MLVEFPFSLRKGAVPARQQLLRSEDLCFSGLDRFAQACHLLLRPTLALQEAAFLLGGLPEDSFNVMGDRVLLRQW